jgi:hypothetical protein
MAKVYAVHEVELRPGVSDEAFEHYVQHGSFFFSNVPGVVTHLVKGECGGRIDKYMVLFEFDSVETRNRYWPPSDVATDEIQKRLVASEHELWEHWAPPYPWTDYVECGSSPE